MARTRKDSESKGPACVQTREYAHDALSLGYTLEPYELQLIEPMTPALYQEMGPGSAATILNQTHGQGRLLSLRIEDGVHHPGGGHHNITKVEFDGTWDRDTEATLLYAAVYTNVDVCEMHSTSIVLPFEDGSAAQEFLDIFVDDFTSLATRQHYPVRVIDVLKMIFSALDPTANIELGGDEIDCRTLVAILGEDELLTQALLPEFDEAVDAWMLKKKGIKQHE